MNLIWRCSFEQFCGINMIGGSVKSDEGILKSIFVLWLPYSTAGGAGEISKLTWPTHPSTTLFHAAVSLIIGDDHSLIRQAWILALIPYLVTLYLLSNATRFIMLLLCILSMTHWPVPVSYLRSKNSFQPKYHSILRVNSNIEFPRPSHLW